MADYDDVKDKILNGSVLYEVEKNLKYIAHV